jgi:site-specific recombinase xerD
MKKDRLTVLFYRRNTVTKTGECAIRMRISVNGTRIDSNTGKYIDPALWYQSKERAKGTSKNAIDLNDYIDETNIKLFKLFQDM